MPRTATCLLTGLLCGALAGCQAAGRGAASAGGLHADTPDSTGTTPDSTGTPTDTTEGTTPTGGTTDTTTTPPPTWEGVPEEAGGPPLYGFWGLNGFVTPTGLQEMKGRVALTVFQTANEDPVWTVGTLLPQVRAAGLHVTLRLTGDHPYYTSEDGGFDIAAWKTRLALWRGSGLQPFVDDGTLAGHMILDDVTNFSGHDPTAAELDEMARYSKELFPGLLTFVRQKATDLPVPAGGTYTYLDAQVNQYEAMEGPVDDYAVDQSIAARRLGLGVINGMNIADGGDGSSAQPGYRADHWAMSAEEIAAYGIVLARVPSCGMFLNWEYDAQERWSDGSIGADYFRQPELEAALAALAERVGRHRHVTLLKPASGGVF